MKPYYQEPGITIYHADFRDVLTTVQPYSCDLVLTDPPYGVSYVTGHRLPGDPMKVAIAQDNDLNAVRDVTPLLDILLKPDRHIYMFGSALRLGEQMDIMRDFWHIKNVIVWDKGDAGTVGDLDAGYGWNWEPIIYASKGRRNLNGPRPRTMYRYDWSASRDPVHPTVKPVGLLVWLLLKSTDRGEMIIDPFMGSGTTLAAAKMTGRQAIGCEIKEEYCEAAVRRLRQSAMAFDEAPREVAVQGALV